MPLGGGKGGHLLLMHLEQDVKTGTEGQASAIEGEGESAQKLLELAIPPHGNRTWMAVVGGAGSELLVWESGWVGEGGWAGLGQTLTRDPREDSRPRAVEQCPRESWVGPRPQEAAAVSSLAWACPRGTRRPAWPGKRMVISREGDPGAGEEVRARTDAGEGRRREALPLNKEQKSQASWGPGARVPAGGQAEATPRAAVRCGQVDSQAVPLPSDPQGQPGG